METMYGLAQGTPICMTAILCSRYIINPKQISIILLFKNLRQNQKNYLIYTLRKFRGFGVERPTWREHPKPREIEGIQ